MAADARRDSSKADFKTAMDSRTLPESKRAFPRTTKKRIDESESSCQFADSEESITSDSFPARYRDSASNTRLSIMPTELASDPVVMLEGRCPLASVLSRIFCDPEAGQSGRAQYQKRAATGQNLSGSGVFRQISDLISGSESQSGRLNAGFLASCPFEWEVKLRPQRESLRFRAFVCGRC